MAGVAGAAAAAAAAGVVVVAVVEANRTLLQVCITCLVRSEVGRTLMVKEPVQLRLKAVLDPFDAPETEILFRVRDPLTNHHFISRATSFRARMRILSLVPFLEHTRSSSSK